MFGNYLIDLPNLINMNKIPQNNCEICFFVHIRETLSGLLLQVKPSGPRDESKTRPGHQRQDKRTAEAHV